ncbi:TonB-dependent receptor domain-containing protein [Phenylobacterium aquaticum]|uniref:TonB-dependent receptor domain-containing protein n=1 Tax=Phenylobacterium aquaticum TaxID=1763816 RepID=UPI001F5DF6C8|nr:TonB-dependent receptor [Phenylobacterium aquaticum]MCI3132299.1 TonB-dependent receptor [Phenylobacterium aquaticum]
MQTTKATLLASSLICAVAALCGQPAWAQGQGPTVDELIVTGSRIPRPNLEQPTPVTTINSLSIENSGLQSLGDVLAQLPALTSSGTVRANSDSGANLGGLSFPDLRGLGTSRTLTLVNGKRHVAGDAGDTAVDLNSIPTALVDRVEVITGGASAIYGSDAVSGVINVILKDNFTGYEFQLRGGAPIEGSYGQNYSASATGGWGFAEGRGNVTLSLFGDKQEQVSGRNIRGLADWGTIANPADTGPKDGIPDRLYRPYVQTEFFSRYGNIITDSLEPVTGFDANGKPVAVPPRIGDNNLFYGAFAAPCPVCFSEDAGAILVPRQTRYGAASTFHYDFSDKLRFKGDVKYVESDVRDTFSPSFTTFDYGLDPDNAFITPAIQAQLDRFPTAGFFYVNRINYDIGGRDDDTMRRTFRAVAQLEGEADARFADVKWETSYNYGRTRNNFHSTGGLIPGNFLSAIDAVVDPANGQVRCRRDVPSTWYPGYELFVRQPNSAVTGEPCVPFNLFGAQNSKAAIDYVTFEADRSHTITQQVADATFSFDTERFLKLPGGPIGFAGGLEWRREQSRNINDPLVLSGITETAPQPNAIGGFEVREAFLEFDAPILKDRPWFHQLSFNGAVRVAHYSHAGDATAYKFGTIWSPVRDLSFRGTYSQAVRAPNITEAFLPATSGFAGIFDPCEASSINVDPDRAANCKALGVTFKNATDNQFPGVTSGNPDLRPEKAKTWTAGFVLQPRWTPGLSLTVDYYDIDIKDAIAFLDPQDAADKCVDGPSLATQYCNLIIRDPVTRQITSYISSYLNQSELTTAGYDIQLNYSRGVADLTEGMGKTLSRLDGMLTGSVTANYTEKLRVYAFADFPNEVDRKEGELGNPRWSFVSALAYAQGPLTVTWQSQYTSKVRRNKDVSLERSDRPYVEAVWYQDLVARYRLDYGKGTEVYVGVNNLFDKTIPIGLTGNTSTTASYDIYGRFVFAGVKARF